ncbi:sugar ABC transporter substrate-binding protein [Nocardiopsis lambiniae]|uniref:Maltose ABC transporter substrate-binding protein n=1 Tax=Nocardiopsis lambiniae TaxID=3075539 RepID=A0ABU2M477_9ACTN|nr:maltose ABC transporter substrate-binding protein [Nocardiopsis sp. DSM 44743]MDT0327430.1 maltose ABC transporter substrate-binding protein [Nocardiopsis sp. DSM 44743]
MNPTPVRPSSRPRAALVGAVACTSLLLTSACASDDDAATAPTSGGHLIVWADDERALALMTFAESYSRTTGAQVEIVVVENEELRSAFLDSHAGGLGPDILVGPHDWTGELVAAGAIAPVDLDPGADADLFTGGALDALTVDGRVYGIPYATENLALLRNTDLAPDEPATFEELVATGEALVGSQGVERPLGLQVGEDGDAYHLHPLFTSAGGELFGSNTHGEPDPTDLRVDDPESIAAFERLGELGEGGTGALTREVDSGNAGQLFQEGRTPFLVSGPWSVAALREAGVPYAVSPIPPFEDGGPARPLIGVQAFFLSSGAAEPELAARLATDFTANPEFSVILYEADPRVPALMTALDVVAEQDPDLEEFQRAGELGTPMPAIPEMEAVWTPLSEAGAAVIGGADAEEQARLAADRIRSGFE